LRKIREISRIFLFSSLYECYFCGAFRVGYLISFGTKEISKDKVADGLREGVGDITSPRCRRLRARAGM
jgi:hypothetical protein